MKWQNKIHRLVWLCFQITFLPSHSRFTFGYDFENRIPPYHSKCNSTSRLVALFFISPLSMYSVFFLSKKLPCSSSLKRFTCKKKYTSELIYSSFTVSKIRADDSSRVVFIVNSDHLINYVCESAPYSYHLPQLK